jgi:hypothetical protein
MERRNSTTKKRRRFLSNSPTNGPHPAIANVSKARRFSAPRSAVAAKPDTSRKSRHQLPHSARPFVAGVEILRGMLIIVGFLTSLPGVPLCCCLGASQFPAIAVLIVGLDRRRSEGSRGTCSPVASRRSAGCCIRPTGRPAAYQQSLRCRSGSGHASARTAWNYRSMSLNALPFEGKPASRTAVSSKR